MSTQSKLSPFALAVLKNLRIFGNMKKEIKNCLDQNPNLRSVEVLERSVSLDELSSTCLDVTRCKDACMACPNYAKLWTCPPFEGRVIDSYETIDVIVCRIPTLKDESMDVCLNRVYTLVKDTVHKVLLSKEREKKGLALSFAGSCSFCKEKACARLDMKPCRHPDLARKSLEGIGFDVGKILKTFFGIELQWSENGATPDFLTFVAGVMYS